VIDEEAPTRAAIAAFQAGRIEEAIGILREAIGRNPGAAAYHNNLGVMLLACRRVEEAIGCFREALRVEGGHQQARLNLFDGLVNLAGSVGPREAEGLLREALSIRADVAEAHYNLADGGGHWALPAGGGAAGRFAGGL